LRDCGLFWSFTTAVTGVNVTIMGRVIFLLFLLAAIPWAIATGLQMRRAQSARERAWVGRMSLAVWLFSVIATMAVVLLSMRGQLLALLVFVPLGFGVRQGLKKARARIRAEEGDPLTRAKRLN
jgi:hypothetical protein